MEFSLDKFYRMNRRIVIWIALIAGLWLLRGFFDVVFMTFVLAFIATPIARFLQQRLHFPRRMSVVAVFLAFLFAFIGFAVFVTPQVLREATYMIANLDQTQDRLIEVKKKLVSRHPVLRPIMNSYVRGQLSEDEYQAIVKAQALAAEKKVSGKGRSDSGGDLPPASQPGVESIEQIAKSTEAIAKSTEAIAKSAGVEPESIVKPPDASAAAFDAETFSPAIRESIDNDALLHVFQHYIGRVRLYAPGLAAFVGQAIVTLSLALLFSFLITMDISRLTRELQNLRESRLHDFYEQTAGPVVRFAYVVGRAIQAQALIAIWLTILTVIGLITMGIPSVAMLAMMVFLCSFIPVLGVFISTVPIALVALNSSGLSLALVSIVYVCVVHTVAAYLLTPWIYGKHLKINPVIVLIILFIGHRAFGVWGMLLGVPVAHYFLHDVFGVPVWSDERLARRETEPGAKGNSLGTLPRSAAKVKDVHHPADAAARVEPEE